MADSLNHVTGTRFTLGTDHGSTLVDTTQSLAQILCTADKRHIELGLVDVVLVICRREHFTLVDIVDLDRLQDLCFCEMTDTALCHNRNADSFLNAANHFRITHTGHTAGCTNVCRNAFQSHNGTGTGCFSNLCLFRCGNVHNDTALEHLCQIFIQFITTSHDNSSRIVVCSGWYRRDYLHYTTILALPQLPVFHFFCIPDEGVFRFP